jgi:hypothetical protein
MVRNGKTEDVVTMAAIFVSGGFLHYRPSPLSLRRRKHLLGTDVRET